MSISESGRNSDKQLSFCEVIALIIKIIRIIVSLFIIIIVRWKYSHQQRTLSAPNSVLSPRFYFILINLKNLVPIDSRFISRMISQRWALLCLNNNTQAIVRVHGNVCIVRDNQKRSWDQAKSFCQEVGGDLLAMCKGKLLRVHPLTKWPFSILSLQLFYKLC